MSLKILSDEARREDRLTLFRCSTCSVFVLSVSAIAGGIIVTLAALNIFGGVNSIGFILATSLGGSCVLISGTAIVTIVIANWPKKHAANINLNHGTKIDTIVNEIYSQNNLENLKQLLEGEDGNLIDAHRLLHTAVKFGTAEIVKFFIEKGANVKTKNAEGKEPIEMILFRQDRTEDTQILDLLCAAGAESNRADADGYTLLHEASQGNKDFSSLIKHLVDEYCLDVNLVTELGSTPLHLAVKYGSLENIVALLECEADDESKDGCNKTPLMIAKDRLLSEDNEQNRKIVEKLETIESNNPD